MPIKLFEGKLLNHYGEFLTKKAHIICPAVNGLTVYNVFATTGGILDEQATHLCNIANQKNETCTLYPISALTIIPLSIFDNRNDFGNELIMSKHIADCFVAEKNYIKSSKMIFVFEKRQDFDSELALKILLKDWKDTEINVQYLPT